MLNFKRLHFSYPGGSEVFKGLDLRIDRGERVVLAGAGGSGKSTLLKLASGLLEPVEGRCLLETDDGLVPVGIVLQEPENQVIAATVEEEIAFGLENLGVPTAEIRRCVEDALGATGLVELRYRAPSKLSGGEMQRVAFAAAYALNPSLWLLDEPATFLDPFETERLHGLILRVPDESALLYVASSPQEYRLGDRLVVLADGKVAGDGPPEEVFDSGLLAELALTEPRERTLAKRGRRGDGVSTVTAVIVNGVMIHDRGEAPDAPAGVNDTLLAELHSSPLMGNIELRLVGVSAGRRHLFEPEREVIGGIDIAFAGGNVTAIVGQSGVGKTTLLEVMAGLLAPTRGRVEWNDSPPEKLLGRIGVAFQFPERSFFADSVLDEVAYGPRNLGFSKSDAARIAELALAELGLDPDIYGHRSPFDLSGGEARRTALAAVWALRPLGYLLDEPTAGLDEISAGMVGRMILSEAERGCIIIVAGHDLDRFADWAGRWVLLDGGKVARDGDPRCWWGDDGEDPWPPPATVRAWRREGRKMENMPGLGMAETMAALSKDM